MDGDDEFVQQVKPTAATDPAGQQTVSTTPNQVTVGDGTTPQVLMGYQPDGFGTGVDYGIKVAQPGVDVNSATDSQLVMSSAFNMFKIVDKIEIVVPLNWATHTTAPVNVPHSYGYAPVYFAFVKIEYVYLGVNFEDVFPVGLTLITNDLFVGGGANNGAAFRINATSYDYYLINTNIIPGAVSSDDGNFTFTLTVYIMQETAG